MEKVVIIGAGPAGYTAAVYAARAHLEPLVIEGPQPGGQLTTTSEVDNWPGEENGILGPELMRKLKSQAARFSTRFNGETVTTVDFSAQPLKITTDAGQVYETQTVIVATGATARRLGLESEKALYGKGVSACATCDGFFFRGKTVAVVGGGDSAMEEALYLSKFATKVTILNRTDQLKASMAMLDRVKAEPKIRGVLELDDLGYIICPPGTTMTKIPGVFAAGDVMDRRYRQAVTAAASGCGAALEAERFLTHRNFGEMGHS
jgi:thioredoxin reductase (NADPH)